MSRNEKVVLTGIKPTGTPHLGNYVGAIKPAIAMTKDAEKSLMFIADYHAINSVRDPEVLKASSREIAATFIALGLDTEKTIFYRQSNVPEIFELTVALAAVTSKGMMNRAHAYKAAIDRNRESGKTDLEDGINMGLYTYPHIDDSRHFTVSIRACPSWKRPDSACRIRSRHRPQLQ